MHGKDNGRTRWQYRYDTEHPLGRRTSKTRRQTLHGAPHGKTVTTRFIWEGFRLLQEVRDGGLPLTYVYDNPDSYAPLARIDGVDAPEIFWFHCQPNGTPERLTDAEGRLRWEGLNGAWGKLLRESPLPDPAPAQNLRMQGQYLDRDKFSGRKFEQRNALAPKGRASWMRRVFPDCTIICSATTIRTADGLPSRTR